MRTLPGFVRLLCLTALLASASAAVSAQDALPAGLSAKIDKVATEALAKSGVPSASVAVVRDGRIVYAKAYGDACIDPKKAATPAMRYSIGSISKEFTAAAILLLQQQGKLSLDDKVAKFFPELTDADHVTIRQILSHTSGYQDYWPQDYLMPMMRQPTTPVQIMDGWAKKPLDFAPGTQWQYSNTGYVIAGAIVQKVAGEGPFAYLQQHVFPALGITDAWDSDQHPLPAGDACGYSRYALGPLRPAPQEGPGWMFAAGELALTASDLARWDIAMIDHRVLSLASWRAMQTEVVLNNGLGSGYGLGVFVGRMDNHRMISHDGEVMGFTAGNYVFPDDRSAVVVLTNQDAVGAFGVIANGIAKALFEVHDAATTKALAQAEAVFSGLQHGKIERRLFSANGNSYFDATALKDYQSSLAPLGKPTAFTMRATRLRGGMQMRAYTVEFSKTKLSVSTYTLPDGKLEQYIVAPTD